MSLIKSNLHLLILSFILCSYVIKSQNELTHITNFGSNPGNLKLMFYDPENINSKSPLVVVLHGCTQTAKSCSEESGWNKLAKLNQFYVLYPEQTISNNPENCFNWYRSNDQSRDIGEPASIKQMISHIKKIKHIDSTKIYIIGLSAGGAMSSIMMAVYPELFDKGGVIAGGPYKSCESILKAIPSMLGMISKSAETLGNLVKQQNPNFKGSYPELVIFHGENDNTVSINNADQLITQWTNIHNFNAYKTEHYSNFKNNKNIELTTYKNNLQQEIVRYYKIHDIGHTLPIDTGKCNTQGGKTGMFAKNIGFHSTFWAAYFFELIKPNYQIKTEINSTQIRYSIPKSIGSTYFWDIPNDFNISNNLHNNYIILDKNHQNKIIEVTESDSSNCKLTPCKLLIDINDIK